MRIRSAVLVCLVFTACSAHHAADVDAGDDAAHDAAIDAGGTPHRGLPPVANHGGHVLSAMQLVVITAPSDPLAAQLAAFCDVLVHSAWWPAVTSEYELGAPRGCVHAIGAAISAPTTLDDTQLTAYIANAIAASSTPIAPDGQTMYLLYLPPQVTFAGGETCAYSGYHESYGTLGDGWGVVERCLFDFSNILESLTVVGSHEVVEAATDPDGLTGWGLAPTPGDVWLGSAWSPYSGAQYLVEVGDFCISTRVVESGYSFQRSFSNVAAAAGDDACVPALAAPFYNLTSPSDWYAVAPGQAIDIPLTGWVTHGAPPWQISFLSAEHSVPGPPTTAMISGPKVTIGATTYNAMMDGQTSMLHVTMAATATSGMWRTYWVYSFRVDASGADGLDGDDHDHIWRVAVYVP